MNARTDAAPVNWNALKKFSKVFVTILLSLTLGLAAGEPVLASSQSVGTIDSDSISLSNMSAVLRTVQSQYVPDGAIEMRMPVYLSFSNVTSVQAFSYLSGYLYYGATMNAFGIYTGGNAQVVRTYFESVTNDNLSAVWVEGQSLRLYFDNYRLDNPGSTGYVYVGDIIYKFDAAASGFTYLTPTPTTSSMTPSGYLRGTAYEYGFAEAIAYAISQSSDIDSIISWLSDISQNTSYLPSILQELEYDFQDVSYWLQDIAHSNYDLYVLIRDYIEAQNPGEQASEAANIAGSMAAEQAAAEAALVSAAPGNMEDLDAVEPLGILDDVSNSTRFWGTLVQEFSTTSGALWGVFIFALLVGLITFILRLR